MTQNRLIGVGVFLLGGALLFAAGLFLIGSRRGVFERSFEVYAEFSRLAGLEDGANVRVAGLDAGEVEEIRVPDGPAGRFRVRLRVSERLHPIVRADSVASIQTDGLVGSKFIQIDAGSEQAPQAPDGSTIRARDPFEFADLLDKASDMVDTVNATILDLKEQVDGVLVTINETARNANELVIDVGEDVKAITRAGATIADDVEVIVAGVRDGRGTVGRLVNDDELYRRAAAIASEAEKVVQNLRDATEQAKLAISDLRDKEGPAQGLAADLRQTIGYAREALADLAENTEALKRNFFLRGFFNRRGFYDLQELSVQDYRAGALESKDRRALRIWLGARVLFRPDADGPAQLTDEGKARIDSAMSQFLAYPRSSPLVVEGYATEGTRDERFLRSWGRAQVVREYLLARFHRDPNYVGLMPMGAEAPESPAGQGEWDGVALAIFVER
jgi:phospholipid/cholesterol/gamma-HCH transport system substrate-binding protein